MFQIVDFDNDGYISEEDIRLVLRHIPWVPSDDKMPAFTVQALANSQIDRYLVELSRYFKGKRAIDFQDFVRMNSEFSSDLFVAVLTLLQS